MPWLSSRPPGCSSDASCAAYASMLTRADVLDHADRGDRVERLAGELAVVHDADVDRSPTPASAARCARELGLRLGERDAR